MDEQVPLKFEFPSGELGDMLTEFTEVRAALALALTGLGAQKERVKQLRENYESVQARLNNVIHVAKGAAYTAAAEAGLNDDQAEAEEIAANDTETGMVHSPDDDAEPFTEGEDLEPGETAQPHIQMEEAA